MKNLIISLCSLFTCAILPHFILAQAQSVSVSGPGTVEVGIAGSYTATFNTGGDTSVHVTSYIFSAAWIGENTPGGSSGIVGSINGNTTTNPLTIDTNGISLTVPIIWGDFFNSVTSDEVRVTVKFKKGASSQSVESSKSVTIKRVCTPTYSGPTSIQQCCTTPVSFTASACDGDSFTWSITSGGTITSGNGTSTITVTPSISSNFTLTCVARRNAGLTSYTRTSSITINRSQPVTPAISAPSFFCADSVYRVCVPPICGMTGANWTVPSSLQIVSGQGTSCINVTPAAGVAGGTTGSITTQAVMDGGCTATTSPQHNFTIYGAETPPAPQGYITLQLSSGDPCNDPVYEVIWHTTHPYLNGYTSVSPGVVLGGTHPHGGSGGVSQQIKITVCNVNLCSGEKSCIDFWIDRPYPCEGEGIAAPSDGAGEGTTIPGKIEERNSQKSDEDVLQISVYPNPTNGRVFIRAPKGTSGRAYLFDCTGKLIDASVFDASKNATELPNYPLQKGVYILQLQVANETITKKIMVQ